MIKKDSQQKEIETVRITKVIHRIDRLQHYQCEFEGVPSILKFCPAPEINMPVASSMLARVLDNADPYGQGRIRVEFMTVNDSRNDTWLRVMTPSAGSSEKTEKNRGFVFIPEVGDQVMVGFEYGDPNRPYVMGSMFHGKNTEGGGENNFKKSITTRSGSTLTFEDLEDDKKHIILIRHNEENKFSITVDKDKGTMHLETTQDILLKAPDLIRMEAKQIVMKGELIQAHATDTIECVADMTMHLQSGEDMLVKSDGNLSADISKEVGIKGKDFVLEAESKVEISGQQTLLAGKKTTVQGAANKIDVI